MRPPEESQRLQGEIGVIRRFMKVSVDLAGIRYFQINIFSVPMTLIWWNIHKVAKSQFENLICTCFVHVSLSHLLLINLIICLLIVLDRLLYLLSPSFLCLSCYVCLEFVLEHTYITCGFYLSLLNKNFYFLIHLHLTFSVDFILWDHDSKISHFHLI